MTWYFIVILIIITIIVIGLIVLKKPTCPICSNEKCPDKICSNEKCPTNSCPTSATCPQPQECPTYMPPPPSQPQACPACEQQVCPPQQSCPACEQQACPACEQQVCPACQECPKQKCSSGVSFPLLTKPNGYTVLYKYNATEKGSNVSGFSGTSSNSSAYLLTNISNYIITKVEVRVESTSPGIGTWLYTVYEDGTSSPNWNTIYCSESGSGIENYFIEYNQDVYLKNGQSLAINMKQMQEYRIEAKISIMSIELTNI